MTLTYSLLCLACVVVGWIGHIVWLKLPVRGDRYEHPGCYPINNPWDPNDPITKAMIEDPANRDLFAKHRNEDLDG